MAGRYQRTESRLLGFPTNGTYRRGKKGSKTKKVEPSFPGKTLGPLESKEVGEDTDDRRSRHDDCRGEKTTTGETWTRVNSRGNTGPPKQRVGKERVTSIRSTKQSKDVISKGRGDSRS